MAMKDESNSRWEGKTSAELASTTAERVWSILEDFCNIHKWLPIVETCYQVDEGVTGLIRYCASTTTGSDGDPERKITMWAKEKLLMMDPVQRCVSCEVVDSNMGFKSYVATVKVLPIISYDEKPQGCRIEWSFVCDPVEGRTIECFYSYIQSLLQSMTKKIELAFSDDTHYV